MALKGGCERGQHQSAAVQRLPDYDIISDKHSFKLDPSIVYVTVAARMTAILMAIIKEKERAESTTAVAGERQRATAAAAQIHAIHALYIGRGSR